VGNDSSIGAGTTVTKDVPEGALAISRVKQKNIKRWNKKIEHRRKKMRNKKG
jgi:bifunctional UDP-N-acetylglucosamine pyrophosphorylase/glucosamine-1-phosphate N-acetyltransferase